MTEKDLLKQLNNLKATISLDAEWKEKNREVLLSQISSQSVEEDNSFNLSVYFEFFLKPATVLALFLLLIISGGAFSFVFAQDTKPGDSLYIAKKISERARYGLTFDEAGKAKLNVEFASNRAKEMEKVVSDESQVEINQEVVASLVDNFKKEISSAREKMEKISPTKSVAHTTAKSKETVAKENTKPAEDGSDNKVFSANLSKDNNNIQISEQPVDATKEVVKPADSKSILNEAEKLFDNKDFTGSVNKLVEVNDSINNENTEGQVKGESEAATSSK